MANKGNFKGHETKAAKAFATKRTPFSGGSSGITKSDTLHKRLFVECKKRERHAVLSLYRETAELAKKEGKIPVISLKEHRTQDMFFIFEEKDLFSILKEIDLSLLSNRFKAGVTLAELEPGKPSNKLKELLVDLGQLIKKYWEE